MSSKIKLQTKRFPKSRYIDNYKRLKFLPNFIIVFIIFLLALCIYWYYSIPSKIVEVQSPAQLLDDSSTASKSPNNNLQITEFTTNEQQLSISKGSQSCIIEFELDSILTGWVESPFWWKPQDGCSIGLRGIQIAELQPQTWKNLSNQYGSERVKLINDDWIALIVTEDEGVLLGFDTIRLLEPVSNDGFSIAAASDTKEIGNTIYYLSEGCTNLIEDMCGIWSLPVFGGDLIQIETNILEESGRVLLKPLDQLRFARTQDLEGGVNLILISRDSTNITLIRYSISSREVVEVVQLDSSSDLFSDYIR